MPSNFVIDLAKQPFTYAGKPIFGIMFVVGDQWTLIRIAGCPVDQHGNVHYHTTPEQAREIARDLLNNADKDQAKFLLGRKVG
jgi:hypothetical protein